MSEKGNRIFECPNCYYKMPEVLIASSSHNIPCPGCGTETINYFVPTEDEDENESEDA
jgi:hypothetical protein